MQHGIRFALCAAIGVAGCGSSSGGEAQGGQGGMGGYGVELPTAESFYPEKVGNSWTYLVTPVAVELPSYKVVTIEALETVGGTGNSAALPAFRHVTCKSAPTVEACGMPASATNRIDKTIGWLGMNDKTLGNYREQAYKKGTDILTEEDWWEPYRIKIDMSPAHTVAGATWVDRYKEFKHAVGGVITSTSQNENWTVVAVDQMVTITPPGGAPKIYPGCLQVSHSNNSGSMTKSFWYARGIGKVKETGAQTEELIDYKVQP
jgi:hypothetical protein